MRVGIPLRNNADHSVKEKVMVGKVHGLFQRAAGKLTKLIDGRKGVMSIGTNVKLIRPDSGQ